MISNTNSTLYMWEPAANEDDSEFENDFIASTNEFVLTNKVLQRYESEYYRSHQVYPGELPRRINHLMRQQYIDEEAKDLDLSCIEDERNEVSCDQNDRSFDLEMDYELELADY
jgi:hypothetical protein